MDPTRAIPPTVYIIDDDAASRASAAELVKTIDYPTISFDSAEQFLAAYDSQMRGCLIVDLRMPGMSGLELQDKLLEMGSQLPFILVTAYADVALAVRAMERGAITLLEKSPDERQLLAAVQRGLEKDAMLFQAQAERQDVQARLDSLTPEERKVLDMIVAGKANKVISVELDIGLRTVETRRHYVMSKLRAESVADLVRMVLVATGNSTTLPSDRIA
jgi:FixJ family two-component response regulator